MSALFHSPAGGAAQHVQAGAVLDLTTPATADGVTMFRRTLYLRVALDGACDRVLLAPGSALALRFEPCSVKVTRGDDAWVRRWVGSAGSAAVELAYPAPLTRVDSDLYGKAELRRADGDAVSEKATVSGATGTALPEPFVGTTFEVHLDVEKPGRRALERARRISQQHQHRSLSAAAVGTVEAHGLDAAIQQVGLVVELLGGLTALHLAGTPGSPRLTLRSADGGEVLWQWIEPGAHSAAVDFAPADLTADWQAALSRALTLTDAAGARPPTLVLPLEVASDSPCQVRIQQLDLECLLERPVIDAPATLRFGGAQEESQSLALSPQAEAKFLTLQGQFMVQGDAAIGESGALPTPHGIHLITGSTAVLPVHLEQPLRCTAVALGWHPLSERSALTVEIAGDGGGPVAMGEVDSHAVEAGVLYARWPSVDLQPGRYRVRLAVRDGSGVLAAMPGHVSAPVEVTHDGHSRQLSVTPVATLLSPGGPAMPVVVDLNGAPITLTGDQQGLHGSLQSPLEAPTWTLSAYSHAPLDLHVDSVRVAYTPG